MTSLADIVQQGRPVSGHRPWPRTILAPDLWTAVAEQLGAGAFSLLGLWGEADCVHMALLGSRGNIAVVSLMCPDGRFPSVGRHHAPAIRPERAVRDLFGLEPVGAPDDRPWLDHGRWPVRVPLGPCRPAKDPMPYPFLPVEGESLHQVAVGPVHAGIIEPGHFRFHASGETVVRLEQRFGYVHKGIEGLMAGADPIRAAQLAGRTSGDSAVAYALAFARAAEAALDTEPPSRAVWLRALMAELERLANHLGDIGAICNDAAFPLMHAHCGILRERVLRAADSCFGHRLMRDCIVPGGVSVDLDPANSAALRMLTAELRRSMDRLIELYDNTTSLQDRTVDAGIVQPTLARRFAAGGFVGRASGRDFDVRRAPGYAPYDALHFRVPVREKGDVNSRVWIRIDEIGQSLSLIGQIVDGLPGGALSVKIADASAPREGMALVEGFRGDILVWLRLGVDGKVARCHLRDPSWFQWPLLEAAIEGNIVADFPLCNKSFNCSYSGHDL